MAARVLKTGQPLTLLKCVCLCARPCCYHRANGRRSPRRALAQSQGRDVLPALAKKPDKKNPYRKPAPRPAKARHPLDAKVWLRPPMAASNCQPTIFFHRDNIFCISLSWTTLAQRQAMKQATLEYENGD
jgi:hypothetical protein